MSAPREVLLDVLRDVPDPLAYGYVEWRRRAAGHPVLKDMLLTGREAEALIYSHLAARTRDCLDGWRASSAEFLDQLNKLYGKAPQELKPHLKADREMAERLIKAAANELAEFNGANLGTRALAAYAAVVERGTGAFVHAVWNWLISGRLEEAIRLEPAAAYEHAPKVPLYAIVLENLPPPAAQIIKTIARALQESDEKIQKHWNNALKDLHGRLKELGRQVPERPEELEGEVLRRPVEIILDALAADRLRDVLNKARSTNNWRQIFEGVDHPAVKFLLSKDKFIEGTIMKEGGQRLAEALVYSYLAVATHDLLMGRGPSIYEFHHELVTFYKMAPPELKPHLYVDLEEAVELASAPAAKLSNFNDATPLTKTLATYIVLTKGGGAHYLSASRWLISGKLEEVVRRKTGGAYRDAPILPISAVVDRVKILMGADSAIGGVGGKIVEIFKDVVRPAENELGTKGEAVVQINGKRYKLKLYERGDLILRWKKLGDN